MNITLKEKYLFLEPFTIDLPDFTVVTGLNGSGKTHLLKAIQSNIIITNSSPIQLLDHRSFRLQSEQLINSEVNPMMNFYRYKAAYEAYKQNYHDLNIDSASMQEAYPDAYIYKLTSRIAKLSKKDERKLSEEDFKKYSPIEYLIDANELFSLRFFELCLVYAKKLKENDYDEYLHVFKKKTEIIYHNKDEFTEYYGKAPWIYINEVFDSLNINYTINISDLHESDIFIVNFVNKTSGAKVKFEALSTGEQVIILTALSLYSLEIETNLPKLILMDEPDASLHPSLIKHFLRVIEDFFVKQKGIKVIITTHSPTTVALAPEESIFMMTGSKEVIEKTEKDVALKFLTEDVPSFSVNYENRRQVFVESPYDVEYYENLYNIFSSKLEPEISLSFISSGAVQRDKNGGPVNSCDIVKEVTTVMRNAGNKFIYGIIDYDNKNTSNEYLKVLGNGNRYSTENYFLDPVLLAVFMLIEGLVTNEEMGIEPNENYLSFVTYDNDKLNIVASKILTEIVQHVKAENHDLKECKLINGNSISLPEWFLYKNGHDLEIAIKKAFPKLNNYDKNGDKNGDKTLKIAIIKKVIAIFPDLASEDLLQVLKDVQI